MSGDNDQEEVDFWRNLISQWETSNQEPVPKRMREALDMAEAKYRFFKDAFLSKLWRVH